MKSSTIISFFIVSVIFELTSAFFGHTRLFNTHQEPQFNTVKSGPSLVRPNEKWIEQNLDNFNPQNTKKWRMRYFEDMTYFEAGGPIFIYLGGEWSISAGSIMQGSLINEMAQDTHGALFYTEHRYYGQSHPTANTSTENLKFLSVDQALADVAHFINFIRSSSPDLQDSKVILVGASYSASMAAWMRMKYPHFITGAFASSGPVHAKIDFYEYKEVMSRSIERLGGEECRAIIENAFYEMEELVEKENTTRITNAFNLCQELKIPTDVSHFFYELSDIVAGLVQSHRSGNIEMACNLMKIARLTKEDIEAFASWVRGEQDETVSKGILVRDMISNSECLDFSYENNVAKFSNIEWGSLANRQMRQWIYQTCAEFAWFQTSTSENQFFGTTYGVDYFYRICNDLYDNKFNMKLIEHNIRRTNIQYGGFSPQLTNVVFTNGDLDPWHPMSVLENINEAVTSIMIPEVAHVSDLGAISESDSPEKRAAKLKVKELVMRWLGILNIE